MRSTEATPILDDRDVFDLLERRSDGTTTWHGVVDGLAAAQAQLRRLAAETGHQCFAVGSDGIVALVQQELVAQRAVAA
jgi:hypothetical protein